MLLEHSLDERVFALTHLGEVRLLIMISLWLSQVRQVNLTFDSLVLDTVWSLGHLVSSGWNTD